HVRNNSGADNSHNTVDRFWQVDATGTPTATLTFTWATGENAALGNVNPRAQRWVSPALGWEQPISGQVNPTSQSVLVSNVSAFGPWAVALQSSPLPIELLSFTATPVDNKEVLCKWSTATEINNDFFTVERSHYASSFETVGEVDGAGNSTAVLGYSFIDEHPYMAVSYYRLKQTDFNGEFSYSKTVAVDINKNKSGVLVYPNPTTDHLIISFSAAEKEKYYIKLFDAAGRLIISKQGEALEDGNVIDVNTTNLPGGIYSLQFFTDEKLEQIKVVRK
ncbi:MAG: T9SS type A sorting domain-containing protein, partial [Bacteroidota bacterium]